MGLFPHAMPDESGRNPEGCDVVHCAEPAVKEYSGPEVRGLMEQVVERENMMAAWKRVRRNDGAPGVDGMTTEELWPWLQDHWSHVKVALLDGRYEPKPVRRVQIPKPGGKGMRELGIPTVLDRLIQQALHQCLLSLFDPGFSDYSYGYRPGRSAQQAVRSASAFVREGRRWVVDLDLEKFFDRVHHDKLMHRVSLKVRDKRVLRLIRRYLQAGVMDGGVVRVREEGTPQGGPLSPLLSNILLDDLDKELEKRGHSFCRYADDCNIYVRSRRSGERVLTSVTRYLQERLSLNVNQAKSAVDRPWNRRFLGYSVTYRLDTRLRVSTESEKRFRKDLLSCFRRGRGRNLEAFICNELNPKLRGWGNYYRYCGVKGAFLRMDAWVRRRLRLILWRQWRTPRTRWQRLLQHGVSPDYAGSGAFNARGPWWNSGGPHMHTACPKRYFDTLGLVSLLDKYYCFRNAR